MEFETIYPADYYERLKEYNTMVSELADKRRQFYEDNRDFPFKGMYMNVIAPPAKMVIITTM